MALDVPTLTFSLNTTLTGAAVQGAAPSWAYSAAWALPLTTGTGLNNADKIYAASITLTASSGQDVDLAGVLTDAFGVALTFVKLKAIGIKAASGNTNNVNVSRPASNGVPWLTAASDAFSVGPGGFFVFVNPAAAGIATVTAATGDIIRFDNSGAGTSVTFDLILIGTSA